MSIIEWLTEPLWQPTADMAWPWRLYQGFNLVEAGAWFVFSGLVVRRWWRNLSSGRPGRGARTAWELGYTALFVAFGVSDLREMVRLQRWLILAKGAIFAGLLGARRVVLRRYYPESRTY